MVRDTYVPEILRSKPVVLRDLGGDAVRFLGESFSGDFPSYFRGFSEFYLS